MRRGYFSLGAKDIFDPRGRIDRLTFFMYGAALAIVGQVGSILVDLAITVLGQPQPVPRGVYLAVEALLLLPLLYGRYCILSKRLHDIGLPGILGLLYFGDFIFMAFLGFAPKAYVPPEVAAHTTQAHLILLTVSLGLSVLLLFIPGNRGGNRYGERDLGDRPRAHVLDG